MPSNAKRNLLLPANVAPLAKKPVAHKGSTGTPERMTRSMHAMAVLPDTEEIDVDAMSDENNSADETQLINLSQRTFLGAQEYDTDNENKVGTLQSDEDVEHLKQNLLSTEELFMSAVKFDGEWRSVFAKRLAFDYIPKCSAVKLMEIFDVDKEFLENKYNSRNANKYRPNLPLHEWLNLKPDSLKGNSIV